MSRTVTVLLVEDDVEMLDGIADLLEAYPSRYDLHILKASNGKMALELMATAVPDLIVSDIMMPEMEGFEFLKRVRQNPDWMHIPFIFLTARGKEGDIRKGRLSEADLYMTKPFATAELAELIQTQLDRSFDRQRHREQTLDLLKKNMLQILNHEFRTPLTYVTAYYEMLESSPDGRNYHEFLRGIQAGCVRLTLLVSDLIEVVDLRSGVSAEQFQHQANLIVDLNMIVQAAVETKKPLAEQKRVAILFTPADDLPPIWGDAQSLQIIFERLLDNAIKFSRPLPDQPAIVHVHTFEQNQEVGIAIRDEGTGIPPAMHKLIFDLFEQHNRGLMEQQGAGMGLTIARELANLHHGRIEVESQVNKGSTFKVMLPIHTEQSWSSSLMSTTTDRRQRDNRKSATILLVEDEENLLYGLADLLMLMDGNYDLHILTALNGRLALDILETSEPDLIISDIMMPHMDGYQFLTAVRQSPQWASIPFIFLTAKGEKRDQYEGYRLGVEEYITKPYDTDDVLRYVEKQLDKHFQSKQSVRQDFDGLKRSILNLVTPDLMQPLTAVNVHTTKLAEGLEQTHSQEELSSSLREIQTGGIRLSHLIEDLIALAELQTGETATAYNWQAQPIAGLNMLLFETSRILAAQFFPATEIDCPFREQIPVVFGDSKMLMECVERLLKYCVYQGQTTPETVILDIAENQGEVQLSITSSVLLQPQAFAHFQQVLASDEVNLIDMPDYVASLHIVEQYVALHHGRLSGQNAAHTGCCFIITLPVYQSSTS